MKYVQNNSGWVQFHIFSNNNIIIKDYFSASFTSSPHVRKRCDNESNVVKENNSYFVAPPNEENEEAKWEIKLKPHEKTDPYKKDRNLIGGVVYGRGGEPIEKGTAVFAFKDPQALECHAGICKPDTQHARLYKEMYGKCPEEEKDLVANGFAYNHDEGGLFFNSSTLNDKSMPYLDKKRYSKNESRVAGEVAQEMIRNCTDKWMEDNCPIDWAYSPQTMEISKK